MFEDFNYQQYNKFLLIDPTKDTYGEDPFAEDDEDNESCENK